MSKPVFSDGRVHVMRRQCATCIFRPGNLMHLQPSRVEDMIAGAGDEGCIPCHSTLDGLQEAVCRGYFDQHRNAILRMAVIMGVVEES